MPPSPGKIWAGQCAGFTVLVLISVAIALGLAIVPDGWVGLLGLIPFILGARAGTVPLPARPVHHRVTDVTSSG